MINAALLDFYFILSYHFFFVTKFNFSSVYILVNTIFEWLYNFFDWERRHQLGKYTTCWGDRWSSEMCTAAYSRRERHASYMRTYLHYLFSCFLQHFCLIVSFFICINLTLPFWKKVLFLRNGYFSPTTSICVNMK